MKKQVLFIQGAGQEAYEEDEKLVANLRDALGTRYEVTYPRMPDDDSFGYESWKKKLGEDLSTIKGDTTILVGHSFGASVLLKYLSEEKVEQSIAGSFLIATPYWSAEAWQAEYALRETFAPNLPEALALFFYHSRDDDIVPFEHLELYREKLPQAAFCEFEGRGHQFKHDLAEVARDIKAL